MGPFKKGKKNEAANHVYEKEFNSTLPNINLVRYQFDAGYISPMKYLETVLKLNTNSDHIGIFQLHDDLLLNFTHLQSNPNWRKKLISECAAKAEITLQKLDHDKSEYAKWGHWYKKWGYQAMKKAESDEQ